MIHSEQLRSPKALYKKALEYIETRQNALQTTGKFQMDDFSTVLAKDLRYSADEQIFRCVAKSS